MTIREAEFPRVEDKSAAAAGDVSAEVLGDGKRGCARCGRIRVGIHARGLCGNCYRLHRDEYPKARNLRAYTARERELIRRDWGKRTAAEIAAELGRDRNDVYAAARRFGVSCGRPCRKVREALRRKIVKLHGKGLSDREIGQVIGRGHATVARWLRRAGLPSNCRTKPTDPFPERTKLKLRRQKLAQIRKEGLEHAVPFMRRHAEGRRQAVRMGWPQAETLLEAMILDCLFEHGPTTTPEIAEGLGRKFAWTANRVRSLQQRGLVVTLYRVDHWCVYALAYGLKRKGA